MLPQALDIIFEVQKKKNNEKNQKLKKKNSNLQNTFFFPYLNPSYFLNHITFFF
jgi:hypothetical protein